MTNRKDGFEVYEGGGDDGQWYWRLRRRGRVVADGAEAYTRRVDVVRAVRSLKRWLSADPDVTVHDPNDSRPKGSPRRNPRW